MTMVNIVLGMFSNGWFTIEADTKFTKLLSQAGLSSFAYKNINASKFSRMLYFVFKNKVSVWKLRWPSQKNQKLMNYSNYRILSDDIVSVNIYMPFIRPTSNQENPIQNMDGKTSKIN